MTFFAQPLLFPFLTLSIYLPLAWAAPVEIVEPSVPDKCFECASNGADTASSAIGSGLPTSVIVVIVLIVVLLTILCIYLHYRGKKPADKAADVVSKQLETSPLGSTADLHHVDDQTGLLGTKGRAS
ncbi:hypothetical protein FB45DRAFT_915298 [Roridomyces roridus]|uniref:Uncharacterized protein n=1 Tax=Roridomyces roridus TaxID=1738132 RepID=A0AAD7BT98_9AGAR|nr:hypothetical protein FB45DRAFT_915298 [Roridomyces roridus]